MLLNVVCIVLLVVVDVQWRRKDETGYRWLARAVLMTRPALDPRFSHAKDSFFGLGHTPRKTHVER